MIQDDRLPLKEKFLEYYKDIPIQKYAGYSIGKSEDTVKRWIDEDADFADRVNKAKAEYLLQKARRLPPTFIIPLLFRELTPRQEHTGADGEPIEYKLNDEQLNKLIQSKIRQVGAGGTSSGEGEENKTEPAEVR